ncbi:hypothetical protein LPB03_00635 [Polaribacter vadi]|jgi:replication initiation and membrane attachment protein DnaB|uniref:Transcriptional regulator n=1 Tax=Polaribacter vadi TaxID=1774273 RepID=A0A1B8U1G4_9FLAO|nr:hypothetical protein [Polaribacter vadi]AOW16054.1 hypothetical protein LPB03_00635 [Polaribacter vadi]OBY65619.1 hypothetical protein LPB3_04475 [Polaribacter vadi]
MHTKELSIEHQAVINELKKEPLTSFQILKKTQNVSLILVIYNILDELNSMGILKTYVKQNVKYHYIA